MVPILSLFLRPTEAVSVTIVTAFFGQLSVVRQAARNAVWAECLPFLIGTVMALPLGALLLVNCDAALLRRIVGISTLASACVLSLGWTYKGRRGAGVSGVFGALGGVINGATGQGGPIAVIYLMSASAEPHQQRASIVATVAGMLSTTLLSLVISGAATWETIILGLALGFPYLVGVWGGSQLFKIVPQQNYRRASLGLLFAAGIAALLK